MALLNDSFQPSDGNACRLRARLRIVDPQCMCKHRLTTAADQKHLDRVGLVPNECKGFPGERRGGRPVHSMLMQQTQPCRDLRFCETLKGEAARLFIDCE